MGAETKIQWTDHTFNAWWGCTKVSPGCDNCYAEKFDKRLGGQHWGKGAARKVFGDKHWREPLKWNAAAEKAGKRARVFCSSMADVFDAEAPEGQLERLWSLIRETPHLDWQLLTKRPSRIARALPADWGDGYANVWLGTTVENQEQADLRIEQLVSAPAQVRFLSCEPLLGPVDLGLEKNVRSQRMLRWYRPVKYSLHWIIVGGESGPGARVFDLTWARDIARECRRAGVACFVKQLGREPVQASADALHFGSLANLKDPKGGDWAEWPADLRVRQFPSPPAVLGGGNG